MMMGTAGGGAGARQSQAGALDRLLQPDESLFDLLKRCGPASFQQRSGGFTPTGFATLDALLERVPTGFQTAGARLVEVEGDAACGKTTVLMSAAGKVAEAGGHVLFLDLERRLSPFRLAKHCRDPSKLANIHIARCSSPQEILATLHAIEDSPHHYRLIAIDSLLACYQLCAGTDPLGAGFPVAIPRILVDMSSRLGIVVIASKPVVPFEVCSKTWANNVFIRISLSTRGRGFLRAYRTSKDETDERFGNVLDLGHFDFLIDV